jgi:hypothetical protein
MKNLYTSSEARQILNVSTSTFKILVDNGKIRKETPLGKKQGYYVAEDVDKLAAERAPFAKIEKSTKRGGIRKETALKTDVDWLKPSDLPAILKLDYKVYGENIVGDIGLYISWYKKNHNLTLVSFERGNRENILAYMCLLPLPENTILSVLAENRSELSINPNEVETYDRPGSYTLLAESVVTHPEHPEQLNNVLQGMLDFWYEIYPEKCLEKVYAQTVSDDGDRLVRKLYFSPLYNLSDKAYVLDMRKPGISRIIKTFQEWIKQKDEKTLKTSQHSQTML